MTHYYEKNIVEIKQEYTSFLVDITTPLIYEGLKSIYNKAKRKEQEKLKEKEKNPILQVPSVLHIFQEFLKGLKDLNNENISKETNRIRSKSGCAEWYDDLVKAVIKSNIILLTFNTSKDRNIIVEQKYHDRITTNDFIHKSYISCGWSIFNNPEIFWDGYNPLQIKRNQREICYIIQKGIHKAIRKMLPMRLVLTEYLKNDYLENNMPNNISASRHNLVKNMVNDDMTMIPRQNITGSTMPLQLPPRMVVQPSVPVNILMNPEEEKKTLNEFKEEENNGEEGMSMEEFIEDVKSQYSSRSNSETNNTIPGENVEDHIEDNVSIQSNDTALSAHTHSNSNTVEIEKKVPGKTVAPSAANNPKMISILKENPIVQMQPKPDKKTREFLGDIARSMMQNTQSNQTN